MARFTSTSKQSLKTAQSTTPQQQFASIAHRQQPRRQTWGTTSKMETKVRAGLYIDEYAQGTDCYITFTIQRDDRGEYGKIGVWIVHQLIGAFRNGTADEQSRFERLYPTKRAAMVAIADYMENGHFEHDALLGWCYFENET